MLYLDFTGICITTQISSTNSNYNKTTPEEHNAGMEWNKTTFGLTLRLLCHIFGGHNQKTTSFFFLLTHLFFF